jgi:hypothetical protein
VSRFVPGRNLASEMRLGDSITWRPNEGARKSASRTRTIKGWATRAHHFVLVIAFLRPGLSQTRPPQSWRLCLHLVFLLCG